MNIKKPEKKKGTILFCDIRNFTSLFDNKDPFEAVEFANTVLAELGQVVENNCGTVDRFTGDGFLAHFGFKNEEENHVDRACKAAISIRKKLNEINARRYLKVEQVVSVGVAFIQEKPLIAKLKLSISSKLLYWVILSIPRLELKS